MATAKKAVAKMSIPKFQQILGMSGQAVLDRRA